MEKRFMHKVCTNVCNVVRMNVSLLGDAGECGECDSSSDHWKRGVYSGLPMTQYNTDKYC